MALLKKPAWFSLWWCCFRLMLYCRAVQYPHSFHNGEKWTLSIALLHYFLLIILQYKAGFEGFKNDIWLTCSLHRLYWWVWFHQFISRWNVGFQILFWKHLVLVEIGQKQCTAYHLRLPKAMTNKLMHGMVWPNSSCRFCIKGCRMHSNPVNRGRQIGLDNRLHSPVVL